MIRVRQELADWREWREERRAVARPPAFSEWGTAAGYQRLAGVEARELLAPADVALEREHEAAWADGLVEPCDLSRWGMAREEVAL